VSKRTKSKRKLPEPSGTELDTNLRKSEAILLRLTPADKKAIEDAAEEMKLTKTEFITKSVLMVASKVVK
jgi:uncharacterized protein (DUF1778 family)